jgi:hypothetical protein
MGLRRLLLGRLLLGRLLLGRLLFAIGDWDDRNNVRRALVVRLSVQNPMH